MWAVLLLLLFLPPFPTGAEAASVTQVIDGDTLIVSNARGELQRIRLYGVDCPEKRQAWGRLKKWTRDDPFDRI